MCWGPVSCSGLLSEVPCSLHLAGLKWAFSFHVLFKGFSEEGPCSWCVLSHTSSHWGSQLDLYWKEHSSNLWDFETNKSVKQMFPAPTCSRNSSGNILQSVYFFKWYGMDSRKGIKQLLVFQWFIVVGTKIRLIFYLHRLVWKLKLGYKNLIQCLSGKGSRPKRCYFCMMLENKTSRNMMMFIVVCLRVFLLINMLFCIQSLLGKSWCQAVPHGNRSKAFSQLPLKLDNCRF